MISHVHVQEHYCSFLFAAVGSGWKMLDVPIWCHILTMRSCQKTEDYVPRVQRICFCAANTSQLITSCILMTKVYRICFYKFIWRFKFVWFCYCYNLCDANERYCLTSSSFLLPTGINCSVIADVKVLILLSFSVGENICIADTYVEPIRIL